MLARARIMSYDRPSDGRQQITCGSITAGERREQAGGSNGCATHKQILAGRIDSANANAVREAHAVIHNCRYF
jgi:hypothetical protein